MKRLPLCVLLLLPLACQPAFAAPPATACHPPVVRPLASGQTAVVAEGEFETCSIGSYSVRLYQAAPDTDRTTFFQDGIVVARNGDIARVVLTDIEGKGHEDIVVIVRSVGTGSYLSARAIAYDQHNLSLIAQVEDLPANSDPLAALRRAIKPPPVPDGSDGGQGGMH